MSNPYGRRIIEARKKLGIGQRKAAKLWGFDDSTIQAWEHERRQPQGLYREKLEEVLRRVEDTKRVPIPARRLAPGLPFALKYGPWLVG